MSLRFALIACSALFATVACGANGDNSDSSPSPKPQTEQQRWYDFVFGEARKDVYVKGSALYCDHGYQEEIAQDFWQNFSGIPGADAVIGITAEEKTIIRLAMNDACKEVGEGDSEFSPYYAGTGTSPYQR